eukprot:TRINITY_DN32768_c0_g2_i1.p1 TRINITY_DN32768_c0_g2~~TRINITY_DN32768_c0_g2_i1.p1  ORF type:complete len:298 (+),score=83.68 TRINITY_DN32768_c0_g2_i1:49-942(+)
METLCGSDGLSSCSSSLSPLPALAFAQLTSLSSAPSATALEVWRSRASLRPVAGAATGAKDNRRNGVAAAAAVAATLVAAGGLRRRLVAERGAAVGQRGKQQTVVCADGVVTPAKKRIGVLFVCLGNICRSPTAEAVFRAAVEKRGLEEHFDIDSCGTGGGSFNWYQSGGFSYHEGENADSRMRSVAAKRGVKLTSISRPLCKEDFERFDVILGMEKKNNDAVQLAGTSWGLLDEKAQEKIGLLPTYCRETPDCTKVPDPWYIGTEEAFDTVLDLVGDACDGLLDELCSKHSLPSER